MLHLYSEASSFISRSPKSSNVTGILKSWNTCKGRITEEMMTTVFSTHAFLALKHI